MEAAILQRKQSAQLNQDRAKTDSTSKQKSEESSPDFWGLIIFLPLAVMADLLGVLDLTGFGAIIVRIIDIPILGILWLWRILKQGMKGQSYQHQLMLAFLIELSPFGIIPTWTTFVLYCCFKDTKLGKQTIGKMKKI
ncbi:MAG TPA: hypothetical protein VMW82_01095 [Candidatus Paceibacterota bacterium]|nr:hypothetical protein [Candidatus Paceibacterota bacterium]